MFHPHNVQHRLDTNSPTMRIPGLESLETQKCSPVSFGRRCSVRRDIAVATKQDTRAAGHTLHLRISNVHSSIIRNWDTSNSVGVNLHSNLLNEVIDVFFEYNKMAMKHIRHQNTKIDHPNILNLTMKKDNLKLTIYKNHLHTE